MRTCLRLATLTLDDRDHRVYQIRAAAGDHGASELLQGQHHQTGHERRGGALRTQAHMQHPRRDQRTDQVRAELLSSQFGNSACSDPSTWTGP